MRDAFHESLDQISDMLVEMTRLSGSAIARATTALLDADVDLAESVIAADEKIDQMRHDLEDLSIELLARQQPVATDLRMVVTALQMSNSVERMGDLARHVAKIARLRYPNSAVPTTLRATFLEMGQAADRIVSQTSSIIAAKDPEGADTLEAEDDRMDDLHRRVFKTLHQAGEQMTTEAAVDATLLSRYYERFGDHAVSVGRQVAFLVTGEWAHRTSNDDSDESALREAATEATMRPE